MNTQHKILICAPNWLGDNVMSLPSVFSYRKRNKNVEIVALAREHIADLWRMSPAVDSVKSFNKTATDTIAAGGWVRKNCFDAAYVFPNSFRSALIPFLGSVPIRIGAPGHQRAYLLTEVINVNGSANLEHQAFEYYRIMGINTEKVESVAELAIPASALLKADKLFSSAENKIIGFIPGAAFGEAKQWPEERWIETGKRLLAKADATVAVFGIKNEKKLCSSIAQGIGERAIDFSGRTSLPELTALLKKCSVVICNDCGGMHLSAVAGTHVVAIFGVTDPLKTGPLGSGHTIICARDVARSRDIEKSSPEAIKALRSIGTDEVIEASSKYL